MPHLKKRPCVIHGRRDETQETKKKKKKDMGPSKETRKKKETHVRDTRGTILT